MLWCDQFVLFRYSSVVPITVTLLRKQHGRAPSWWGDLNSRETRILYWKLLPTVLLVEHEFEELPLKERAYVASMARCVSQANPHRPRADSSGRHCLALGWAVVPRTTRIARFFTLLSRSFLPFPFCTPQTGLPPNSTLARGAGLPSALLPRSSTARGTLSKRAGGRGRA